MVEATLALGVLGGEFLLLVASCCCGVFGVIESIEGGYVVDDSASLVELAEAHEPDDGLLDEPRADHGEQREHDKDGQAQLAPLAYDVGERRQCGHHHHPDDLDADAEHGPLARREHLHDERDAHRLQAARQRIDHEAECHERHKVRHVLLRQATHAHQHEHNDEHRLAACFVRDQAEYDRSFFYDLQIYITKISTVLPGIYFQSSKNST